MQENHNFDYLVKFLVASAISFFIGSVHGVAQVMPSIRAWLDSIGSPYGGPGHMIDPLAHAHINLIGGVTLICIAVTYYLLTVIRKQPVYSIRMANVSFWLTTTGIYSFYTVHVGFGIAEGLLLLAGDPALEPFHKKVVTPSIAVTASIMGIGLWTFMVNVLLTFRKKSAR
jgi:cytochrome c oxidase cbb3-type subunit 1